MTIDPPERIVPERITARSEVSKALTAERREGGSGHPAGVDDHDHSLMLLRPRPWPAPR